MLDGPEAKELVDADRSGVPSGPMVTDIALLFA